jgi:hypothetical protein
MESIFWGSGMLKSCADALPDLMQPMTTIAKTDLHIHAHLFSAIRHLDMGAVTRIEKG